MKVELRQAAIAQGLIGGVTADCQTVAQPQSQSQASTDKNTYGKIKNVIRF
jgi:hypothetical protein